MNSRIMSGLIILAMVFSAVNTFGKDKELEESLKAKYQIAQMALDHLRVIKEGTPLVIQQDGIYANPSTNIASLQTKVSDGKIVPPGRFAGSFVSEPTNRTLKMGASVYPTRISVSDKDVKIEIISADLEESLFRGTTKRMRYIATLVFELPADSASANTADSLKKMIDAVLLPQSEVQASSTKTVEAGQTEDQVKSILGAPDKIIKLGTKDEFIYKDIKVIFTDGMVSDVQ